MLGRYINLKNEIVYLAMLARNSGSVCDETIINIGYNPPHSLPATSRIEPNNLIPTQFTNLPANLHSQASSNILIRGFLEKTTGCVLDVQVTDFDAPANVAIDLMKVVHIREKVNKNEYLARCAEQRQYVAPYVTDCYGLFGLKAVAIKNNCCLVIS